MLSSRVIDSRRLAVSKERTALMSKGQGVLNLAFLYPKSPRSRTLLSLKRNKIIFHENIGIKLLLIIATNQKT
jgi:hypothetical protein